MVPPTRTCVNICVFMPRRGIQILAQQTVGLRLIKFDGRFFSGEAAIQDSLARRARNRHIQMVSAEKRVSIPDSHGASPSVDKIQYHYENPRSGLSWNALSVLIIFLSDHLALRARNRHIQMVSAEKRVSIPDSHGASPPVDKIQYHYENPRSAPVLERTFSANHLLIRSPSPAG